MKILIAEDEIFTAMWIIGHLRKLGHDVGEPVATGEEAVKRAEEESPDFILMDIRLGGKIDGIEAAQRILAHRTIPIAFMTGYSSQAIKARAANLKPVAYFNKPLPMDEVENLLRTILPDT